MFADRLDAAARLADRLMEYEGQNPLILAIPRGAVPMGKFIAARLHGTLDVVLVRKISAPGNPEYALGSVDEGGHVFLSPFIQDTKEARDWINQLKSEPLARLRERRALYMPSMHPVDPNGRIVIVVDDGLATGSTMIAALSAIRAKHPAELVCAVPVAATESLAAVTALADKVVCLEAHEHFGAVGRYYRSFQPVDDKEVVSLLCATHFPRSSGMVRQA
ncbi:phosphoribosyltransferase [Noviherbaspirillum malthae]|uniref:phosphoribosyltransferase n=1 Tax=Noviherbaspirillum malthae TaxID=1260987 RepID=UPI00188F4A7B|nr:phosphoribosyltransferase family protein [Noviherbaspirillum malthae]